jgi:hypothetical protein
MIDNKNCQSCGMPLEKDKNGGGTEKDGSKNRQYCSHCYMEGKFTLPGITVEEMRARVKQKMMKFGIPELMAGLLTQNIDKLERWKQS